ncbi:ABC transporter substrate-binding protein [Paenirhodobacter sp.]|uniref:ABC transporter substrate-binding protein n=1 Tax=Paenirhodobacter sp. TaxID=1965326 RepID=UPI003B412972
MNTPKLLIGAAVAALLAGPALADKASNSVHLAFTKELETADTYFNTAREGVLLSYQVWDALLYRDPKTNQYVGNLAVEWSWVDDKTMEFKLRQGVTFHNGEAFTADDVVYTFNFLVDPKNGVKNTANSAWIDHAEKVDDYTVRLHMKAPFPAAEEYLAGPLVIYPDEYYAKVGPSGMNAEPVGTGPYKVVKNETGKHLSLLRNDAYFDGPKGKPTVEKIDIRTIPDVNTQIAEFFNGTLDFIFNVPADQTEKLAALDRYKVVNGASMRIGYLTLDAAGRSDPNGPMTKKEVRQAMWHAIDRQAIVDALVKGASQVINSACAPSQANCAQDVPSYDYDPAKAKELLKQAGYPDGFTIEFAAYRDRPYAEAMMGYLEAVGIKPKLSYMQYAALREKRRKGEVPVTFTTWGSNSVADASASTGEYFTGGPEDDARDPQVIADIKQADGTIDKAARAALYKKALTRIAEEAYWIPLFTYNVNYVMSPDLNFEPTPDEVIRFYELTWN